MSTNHRILRSLEIQNLQAIKKFKLIAHEGVNEIVGPNESGKTTIIDVAQWMLQGRRAISKLPIRRGAKAGGAQMEIDGFTITMILRDGEEPQYKIERTDGEKVGQSVLQQFLNAFTFDPLALAKMDRTKRIATFRKLAGEEWCNKADELKENLTTCEEKRTEAKVERNALGKPKEVEPCESPDISVVTVLRKEVQQHNELQRERKENIKGAELQLNNQKKQLDSVNTKIIEIKKEIERLTKSQKELEIFQKQLNIDIATEQKELSSLDQPEPLHNFDEVDQLMAQNQEQILAHERYENYLKLKDRIEKAEKLVASTDAAVKQEQQKIKNHLAELKLPVDKLEIRPDDVYHDGIPWDNLAKSRKTRICVNLAMDLNPILKTLFIDDAESLDEQSFKEIKEIAAERNYQILMASVHQHTDDAILLTISTEESTIS